MNRPSDSGTGTGMGAGTGRAADPIKRLRRLAWLLDSSIRLPGGFRIGLDGLIGLVPGIGDLLAALLSSYIVVEAARLKVPGSVLMRMVGNVALELGIGVVPVLGDLFDFVFKANQRNVQLLEAHFEPPGAQARAQPHDQPRERLREQTRETQRRSRWKVGTALSLLALLIAVVLALVLGAVWLIAKALLA